MAKGKWIQDLDSNEKEESDFEISVCNIVIALHVSTCGSSDVL